MKKQIRHRVFETNSSSTHSLTMCTKYDYDNWEKDNLFLFNGTSRLYPENNRPQKGHFYTKEDAIAFVKSSKYAPLKNYDLDDEDDVMDLLHDEEWYDYGYYWENYCECYETFEDEMTTPNGEKIVAFGYYGYNG